MKKILLTGFEPFGKFVTNPSAEFMDDLAKQGYRTEVLPVSYSQIDLKLQSLAIADYHFILLFGLAFNRDHISFERVALNWIEGLTEDNSGHLPFPQPIDSSQPVAFINQLPIHQWVNALEDLGLNIKISSSAGTYLCNYLYFQILKINKKCLFIHLPPENDFKQLGKMVERLLRF
jgi:pyroglutamyl-peptidase